MAVYTQLSAEVLADLVAQYDVGELVSAKGIAEGVSNSNWLIETTGSEANGNRFILTMYERRIDIADLPFFLGLLDYLAAHGCPVPRTIHDRSGASSRELDGKAVALIEFLPGVSVDRPTPSQAWNVGKVLAEMHEAAHGFRRSRANDLGPEASARVLAECGERALAAIHPDLPATIGVSREVAEQWPQGLPTSIIHSDLFPDNVLMRGDRVSALIDFYFACSDAMAYDLAVTHAAWSFSGDGRQFRADVGRALVAGYESVRKLNDEEREALPLLAEGAALRFVSSRAFDWIDTPADALVTRKDPMDFVRRLEYYQREGKDAFAS
ncbi:homoserine kinase [Aurantiacibacter poecillastricola]|uniref:homoserine kinase n=1 Tax=Aurantiacibacter poecillastricola TaxID=3064385 RepID=UPI0027401A2B|nr:homoserine kinase [Aurantiacibacter sp. 219JJ12-13]MDP5262835.1 homoserine kinase [Aurantiacibacter sp. 219JJ12-13]